MLTSEQKRLLPENIQRQIEAGYRDNAFMLTTEGNKALLEMFAEQNDKEFTDRAIKKISTITE